MTTEPTANVLLPRAEIVLLQNPFLDPYSVPQGGKVAGLGERLIQIQVPAIQTLVYKTTNTSGYLAAVNVSEALLKAGITPRQPILIRDETIGIELNLNLLGTGSVSGVTSAQMTPAELQGQTVGKVIPRNVREARNVLHMITAQRTGTTNRSFDINELKKIARNLDLPSTGNKDVLANRIRTHIIDYFNLQPQ